MNQSLLRKHIEKYLADRRKNPEKYVEGDRDRSERVAYYKAWSPDLMAQMDENALEEYISKLWAMLIWGNKRYVVDKLIKDHSLATVRLELSMLVWGKEDVAIRWDRFRERIKGIGPAMMSEILSHVFPETCMVWNRRAYVAFDYLGVEDLPRYQYQFTGKKYTELCTQSRIIADQMQQISGRPANLLDVDYFIWEELQVVEVLRGIRRKPEVDQVPIPPTGDEPVFVHNEIRDKIAEIGRWLGFETQTEIKVADGSVVDTVWEATIGNMGRVIYVFEVQTKGSIDSLIINLYKALNNPAVQGAVAVSDAKQLEIIKKHAQDVGDLGKKLKYWDYTEVLTNHESLSDVNESINRLGLVPAGF